MKIRLNKFIKPTAVWLPLFLSLIFSWNPSAVIGGTTSLNSDDSSSVLHRDADRLKILSVLENRMGSQKSLEMVKDKLFHLSDGKTRLIASLSELVANEGNTAGAEIAFLLLTALIVLS